MIGVDNDLTVHAVKPILCFLKAEVSRGLSRPRPRH